MRPKAVAPTFPEIVKFGSRAAIATPINALAECMLASAARTSGRLSTSVLGNVPTTWNVVGTGDFNGDSYGDVLWRDSSGNLAIWFMNGTTVVQTAIIGNVPTTWTVAGADSKGDIFWYNTATAHGARRVAEA